MKWIAIQQLELGLHTENSPIALILMKDPPSVVIEQLSECPAQDVEKNKHEQWLMPIGTLNPPLENKIDKYETEDNCVAPIS